MNRYNNNYFILVPCNWSPWSEYSECSKTCNGGTKTRARIIEGTGCEPVPQDETLECNTEKCPSKYNYII